MQAIQQRHSSRVDGCTLLVAAHIYLTSKDVLL